MTPDGKDPNSKLVDVDWESNGDSFAAAESCLATALSISCCSCYFWEKGSPTKRIVLTPPPCPHMYRTLRRTFLSIKKKCKSIVAKVLTPLKSERTEHSCKRSTGNAQIVSICILWGFQKTLNSRVRCAFGNIDFLLTHLVSSF